LYKTNSIVFCNEIRKEGTANEKINSQKIGIIYINTSLQLFDSVKNK